jgi:hypothetical protein
MSRWFYSPDNRQRIGPVTSEDLRALALAGTIDRGCMVRPESGGKWVSAGKVKGLFAKPALTATPPVATVLFPCPNCERGIPLEQHELSLLVECAHCGTQFIPSQSPAEAPASSTRLNDPALLGLVKDAEQERKTNGPLGGAGVDVRRGSRILVVAIVGVLFLCAIVSVCIVAYRRSANHGGDGGKASGGAANAPPMGNAGVEPSGTSGWTTDFDELDRWCMRTRREVHAEMQLNPLRGKEMENRRIDEFKNGLVGKEVHWKFPVVGISADGVVLPNFRYHPGGSHFPSQILTSRPGALYLMVDFGLPLYKVKGQTIGGTENFFRMPKDRIMSLSVDEFVTVKATVVGGDWGLSKIGVFNVKLEGAVIE